MTYYLWTENNDNMNKGLLQFVFISLLPLGVCQCSSAYRLVDYKEYCFNDLESHITYQYENGALYSKTEILTRMKDRVDSTITYFDVIKGDNSIDSVETSYNYLNDTLKSITKVIRTYNSDGIIRKETYSEYKDGDWKELSYTLYDSKGRWRDAVWHNFYHNWSTYDSLDRHTGSRYQYQYSNLPTTVDTIEYASDGKSATYTQYYLIKNDGKWKCDTLSIRLYRLDKNGRIISYDTFDPDKTDTIPFNPTRYLYKYDWRGRLKSETILRRNHNETEYIGIEKKKYRYYRGRKTWDLIYDYEDGRWLLESVYRYKYDFFHNVLLERTLREDSYGGLTNNLLLFIIIMNEKPDERLVWSYEKRKKH